jgi:glycosyltransferase involved in cell wall biosynthesis
MIDRSVKLAQKLFRPGGLRHARAAIVRKLAQRYANDPVDVLKAYGWVLNEDNPAQLSPPSTGPLRINWVVPGIRSAQGGWFNIVRTIQQLESWGHENRLYVLGGIPDRARDLISKRYFPIKSEVYELTDRVKDSDALIATSWPTAYAVRAIPNTARKFYFIQDLEHMFYAPGSLHTFARDTYKFGFHGITAGSWIAEVLAREFNMPSSPFGFSYDRDTYATAGDRMYPPGKKRVLFYARPETERRGFELGILTLSLVAKELPDMEVVLAGFPHHPPEVPFPVITPGVLPISRLGSLYRSCDAALVLSHTNLSLLPLELMACGCAVVSNTGPNTEWLLSDRNSRLADPDPASLAAALIDILQNSHSRLRLIERASAFVHSTDWVKEIKSIEAVLTASQIDAERKETHAR